MAFNKKDQSASMEEFIRELPGAEQLIIKRLRSLILECLPKATEFLQYGVPFYRHHRMICFIWPPSLDCSKKKSNSNEEKRVGLGFYYGNQMANEDGALLVEGRKQVYYMFFQSVGEINDEQIRALLFEAGLIDDAFGMKKKSKRS
jgi:hypothetical protein